MSSNLKRVCLVLMGIAGIGALAFPVWLHLYLADRDRYLRVISSPRPLGNLGSDAMRGDVYIASILLGCALLLCTTSLAVSDIRVSQVTRLASYATFALAFIALALLPSLW